jgi:transposase InsO family protein
MPLTLGVLRILDKFSFSETISPWLNIEQVKWATLNYVDWFNNGRIHESFDYLPPVEFEAHYYHSNESESLDVMEMI